MILKYEFYLNSMILKYEFYLTGALFHLEDMEEEERHENMKNISREI